MRKELKNIRGKERKGEERSDCLVGTECCSFVLFSFRAIGGIYDDFRVLK